MGTGIRLALGMKLFSGLVFVIGAIVAGVMNRSFPIVILLAAAMTLSGVLARMRSGGGALAELMGQQAEKKAPWDGALQGFILRALGLAFLFGLSVLISAVFQETDMAQRIGQPDLIILGTCFVIALGLAGISQTILAKHASTLGEMMSGIQAKFQEMQQGGSGFPGGGGAPGRAANDDVIEGEFKRKDED